MTVSNKKIAVCSRSFSKHPKLREELLTHFSHVKFNDEGKSLETASLVNFLKDVDGSIIALEKVNEELLSQLPQLKVISKYGVGLDNIDAKALEKFEVKLGHTPGVNRRGVSELVLGYILTFLRKIHTHHYQLTKGIWKNEGGSQLSEKTVGIIGSGFVGQDLMSLLKPFNCKILFCDLLEMEFLQNEKNTQVSLDELLKNADIISVHIPYNQQNHFLINKEKLKLMKKNAFFINTSRGGIVDEKALHEALSSGTIAGAAMDVFISEPEVDNPLFKLPNFIGSPHVGGSSDEAILAMGRAAIAHLISLLK